MASIYWLSASLLLFFISLVSAFIFGLSNRSRQFTFYGWLIIAILTVIYAAVNKLTGQGINESVLYHLSMSLDGVGISDFYGFIFTILLALLLAVFFVFKLASLPKETSSTPQSWLPVANQFRVFWYWCQGKEPEDH